MSNLQGDGGKYELVAVANRDGALKDGSYYNAQGPTVRLRTGLYDSGQPTSGTPAS